MRHLLHRYHKASQSLLHLAATLAPSSAAMPTTVATPSESTPHVLHPAPVFTGVSKMGGREREGGSSAHFMGALHSLCEVEDTMPSSVERGWDYERIRSYTERCLRATNPAAEHTPGLLSCECSLKEGAVEQESQASASQTQGQPSVPENPSPRVARKDKCDKAKTSARVRSGDNVEAMRVGLARTWINEHLQRRVRALFKRWATDPSSRWTHKEALLISGLARTLLIWRRSRLGKPLPFQMPVYIRTQQNLSLLIN